MRHLLLAAPLLALATACAEPCTAPALTVSWRFTLADGTPYARCQDAGVAAVDVWIDDVLVGAGVDCEQGSATFAGVAAGSHRFQVRGYAAGGVAVAQTWGSLTSASCGESRVMTYPGSGTLRVAYPTSTGHCYPPGDPANPGYVWYQLLDRSTGATVSTVNGAHLPLALPCQEGGQAFFELQVPWALYRLRWIQVVIGPTSSQPNPIYQYCPDLSPVPDPPIDVDVVSPGTTTLTLPLSPPTGFCIP